MFHNKLKTDAVAEAVAKIIGVEEELKGNQHKIDANKNGKIDGQDFDILRKKKGMKKEETEPVEEGWDDMLKAVKDKNKPQPSGGSGIKKGTRYGGSKQKDEPEKDDEDDKMKKEEAEQIDELSHDTLRSYVDKAKKENLPGKGGNRGVALLTPGTRDKGVHRAVDRMKKMKANEDVEQVDEVSPPGFEGTVKAMKKHKEIDNPFALAWYMKNKGYKSHKKTDGSMKKEEVEQIDEISTNTLARAAHAAADPDADYAYNMKHHDPQKFAAHAKKYKSAKDAKYVQRAADTEHDADSNYKFKFKKEEVEQIDELTGKGKLSQIADYHKQKGGEAKDKMEKIRNSNRKIPVPFELSAKINSKDSEAKHHSSQEKRAKALMGKAVMSNMFRNMKKEEVDTELDLDEAVSRKHFQQVADVIKAHPDQAKRNELAKHHAEIFKSQNPRFDHSRFYAAAGAKIED